MFCTRVLVLVNDLVHICHCKKYKTNDKKRNQVEKNVFKSLMYSVKVNSLFGRGFNNILRLLYLHISH